jgi:hypothetical protein
MIVRTLPLWHFATHLPQRACRLVATRSVGASQPVVAGTRGGKTPPSVAARPTALATKPGAPAGRDRRPTDAAQAPVSLLARASRGNADRRGRVPACADEIGRPAFHRPPRALQPRCPEPSRCSGVACAQTNASPQPRRPSNPSGLLSAAGADVIFASRPRAPAGRAGLN